MSAENNIVTRVHEAQRAENENENVRVYFQVTKFWFAWNIENFKSRENTDFNFPRFQISRRWKANVEARAFFKMYGAGALFLITLRLLTIPTAFSAEEVLSTSWKAKLKSDAMFVDYSYESVNSTRACARGDKTANRQSHFTSHISPRVARFRGWGNLFGE